MSTKPIAVLGAGNLGSAIARGIVRAGAWKPSEVHLTHLHPEVLSGMEREGHPVGTDNAKAAAAARIVILSVQPQQVATVLGEVARVLDPARHVLVSTATGVPIEAIRRHVGDAVPVVRAMPNLGIQTLNSMTCLALDAPSESASAEAPTENIELPFSSSSASARLEPKTHATTTEPQTALDIFMICSWMRARLGASGATSTGLEMACQLCGKRAARRLRRRASRHTGTHCQ